MGTQTSASVIRSRFTLKNTQEWRWSALDLAKFIPPHPWLHYCHSNSAICIWDPFFLSSPPIKKKDDQKVLLGIPERPLALRRRLRSGPPSPGLSHPEFPPPTSSGWRDGCRTLGPSSRRSSAAQETEQMCETTSRGRRTVKIPTIQGFRAVRAPSHPRTLRGRTWNRHRLCSSRVKAERGGFINNSLCVSSHCGDFLQTYTHSCLYIYLGCGKDSSIFFLSRPKPTIYSISLHVFCVCTE